MTKFRQLFLLIALSLGLTAVAADPTATNYSARECEGTSMPYPTPAVGSRAYPDSLTPLYLSHAGRHGARFLSSSKYTTALSRMLRKADSLKTITPTGKVLRKLTDEVVKRTAGRWGALDSLGMAEQRAIAARTWQAYPDLFKYRKVSAISSYVPRCIASMDEFTHQLARMDNKIEIYTSSGRQNNALMRPWTDDADYKAYKDSEEWHTVYDGYFDSTIPAGLARKILGASYPFDEGEERDFAQNMYKILSGCAAMGMKIDALKFLSLEEYNALWAVNNLEHYLTHSASTLSRAPMDMAAALLNNIVDGIDRAAEGKNDNGAELRFGHAETMMPLLALMRMAGCYYMTNYFDTVGMHWRDFYVTPMATNLQIVLFKSTSGKLYVRAELNETPVPLIPGNKSIYVEWSKAKEYLLRCLPLYLQP
ncbi:MAG: histidine phosphatase family protein [Muribaculaceae bacterium]|nr:histidine phosphatase family protein [Muribaculaceae bacterium]